MARIRVSGTEGYAEIAETFARHVESIAFADVHKEVLHLIPTTPGKVLDIGAGSGRDAAAFAAMGHRVVAVEPTAELRAIAAALHPSPRIDWLDDSLSDLTVVVGRNERFDVVMLNAVWMHLDAQQRQRAMPRVAGLVCPGGIVIFSLRHGPVPPGRVMFDVTAGETIRLAEDEGLSLTLRLENQPDAFGREDVTWTRLAFSRRSAEPELPPGD